MPLYQHRVHQRQNHEVSLTWTFWNSLGEWSFRLRWRTLLSSAGITFIMWRSTTGLRKDILTSLPIFLRLSRPRKVTSLLLASAGKQKPTHNNLPRPLSKTVRFNVLKVTPNSIIGSVKKQFVLFWLYCANAANVYCQGNQKRTF